MASTTSSWLLVLSPSAARDEKLLFKVRHVRSTGLIESGRSGMLADSPDGVMACADEDDFTDVYAIEIKTMNSVRTIETASVLRDKYGPVLFLQNVGSKMQSSQLFREMIFSPQYRAQVLLHSATLGINNVVFVVGTGGSMVEGGILYACIIKFSQLLRHEYTYILDCLRASAFTWIGKESENVPKEYDDMLKSSHASDIYSFISYYSLRKACRSEVMKRGKPIPPRGMKWLTPAVFWNNMKGGVDVVSRYLKTLARTNISDNPVVSIMASLLSMQGTNAAVINRPFMARGKQILPNIPENCDLMHCGYSTLRHRVTKCGTFGSFARRLAKEWTEYQSRFLNRENNNEGSSTVVRNMRSLFLRNAAEKYCYGTQKARRLNKNIEHIRCNGAATYCVLCSYTVILTFDGKPQTKRKGSR